MRSFACFFSNSFSGVHVLTPLVNGRLAYLILLHWIRCLVTRASFMRSFIAHANMHDAVDIF